MTYKVMYSDIWTTKANKIENTMFAQIGMYNSSLNYSGFWIEEDMDHAYGSDLKE